MTQAQSREPFGETKIPPEEISLTASYIASDWLKLSASWQMTMYWTSPEGESIELPSVGLTTADRPQSEA